MKNKWVKFRHKVYRNLVYPFVKLYVKIKSGIKIEKFKDKRKGPFLIIYNHQTGYDQLLLALTFPFPIYQVASDDLFSNGFASSLIKHTFAPIPIKKNVTDMVAVRKCIKVAKEGGSIVLSPEGNRTFSGETCSFNPAIVSLIKMLNLPTIIYRIEGGYNVLPRWADKSRKGKARAYVSKIIEREELGALSKEQLHDRLKIELYQNDYEMVGKYIGKNKAEYLERVAYVCPNCGLSEFHSEGNYITCKKCKIKIEYTDDKRLKGINAEFPFSNYLEWYNYQNEFINKLDLRDLTDKPIYTEEVKLYEVIPLKKKILIGKHVQVSLYGDKIVCINKGEKMVIPFEQTAGASVLGRNKLNVYYNDKLYQLKGDKPFNAVKYLNFYHRSINQTKGEDNGFLGL